MKQIKIKKKPIIETVLRVTKSELLKLKEGHPYISISHSDEKWLQNVDYDDYVGVISGELKYILGGFPTLDSPDTWFINKTFIAGRYDIINTDANIDDHYREEDKHDW